MRGRAGWSLGMGWAWLDGPIHRHDGVDLQVVAAQAWLRRRVKVSPRGAVASVTGAIPAESASDARWPSVDLRSAGCGSQPLA